MPADSQPQIVETSPHSGVKTLEFTGRWSMATMPELDPATLVPRSGALHFHATEATAKDTSLAMTITQLADAAEDQGVSIDLSKVPEGVAKLVLLARAVPEQEAQPHEHSSFVTRAGHEAVEMAEAVKVAIDFCGETVIAALRTLRNPKTFRWREFIVLLGDTGFRALPIVGLLAFLTGLILAFVGAVQLRLFGADLYVADLVGLAMSREMASLMTGMIMSGRSGAAFAAHLGTMKVSEEIDALTTFGFQPVDMLALPRVLALTFMMPMLTLYANLLGYFGGAVIGNSMLDISYTQYLVETQTIVTTVDISIGLFKGMVFGFIIAACGCVQGLHCGKDAAAVGQAATRAVVLSITLIVVTDSIFAVLCEILKI